MVTIATPMTLRRRCGRNECQAAAAHEVTACESCHHALVAARNSEPESMIIGLFGISGRKRNLNHV